MAIFYTNALLGTSQPVVQNKHASFWCFALVCTVNGDTLDSLIAYTPSTDTRYSFLKICSSFQTEAISLQTNQPVGIAIFSNSDGGRGYCWSMGMASSWQRPCTCACKKTGSSDKAFPLPARPAQLHQPRLLLRTGLCGEHRGMEEGRTQPPASPHTSPPGPAGGSLPTASVRPGGGRQRRSGAVGSAAAERGRSTGAAGPRRRRG